MRRIQIRKKLTSVFMAALMCMILLPAGAVQAEELAKAPKEYTVSFRPGNVGKFNVEAVKATYPKCDVTENGAIKLTVSKGSSLAKAASNWVEAKEGYFVKTWGPTGNENVDRNMDFVVDYGKLVNGVEYTIEFVDASTKESVAPAFTAYANVGDKVPVTAPVSLTTSAAGIYHLQGNATIELVVSDDVTKNVVVFEYVNNYDPGDEVQEIVNYTDGGTTTLTDTVLIPGGGAGDGGVVVDAGGDDGAAGGDAGGVDDAVIIDDEDTPLAGDIPGSEGDLSEGTDLDDSEVLIIDDSEVPLADGIGGGFNPVVICAILLAVAAIMMMVLWIVTKKKRNISE